MATVDKYDNFLSTLQGTSSSSWSEAQESVSGAYGLEVAWLNFAILVVAGTIQLHHC